METNVISIGNSKGVIIPAKLMQILSLGNKVSMRVENGKLVIARSEKKPEKVGKKRLLVKSKKAVKQRD